MIVPVPLFTAQAPEPRFESEIRAFEAEDARSRRLPGAVLFVGSSSIRLWTTLAADFPNRGVLNRGFGGSWLADAERLVPRIVVPYRPSAVVLFAGTNDLADGRSPETVAGDFGTFVGRTRAALPNVPIAYIAITPAPSRETLLPKMRETNRLIRAQCERGPNLVYIDTWPQMLTPSGATRPELFGADRLHMNSSGYALWTPLVTRALDRMIPKG